MEKKIRKYECRDSSVWSKLKSKDLTITGAFHSRTKGKLVTLFSTDKNKIVSEPTPMLQNSFHITLFIAVEA